MSQAAGDVAELVASSNDRPLQEGAYREHDRPRIHYSPSSGFMNDPNGLVYSDGLYHLYYQYNPYARVAGNQHWGHAVSRDLLHWHNEPIALYPEAPDEGIFSGSCVVDADNTSGFFDNSVAPQRRIVAMYTLHTPESQTQAIAYSLDGGYSFVKYAGNPVIDLDAREFRDPKVFWHGPTRKWIATTVLAQQYQVVLFASPDLKHWTELSRFGPAGWLGFQYEVPDLVEIPIEGTQATKWVLFLSINPGAPQGGSFVEYFIGHFDGTRFLPDDYAIATQDFGKDFYAQITFSNLPREQGVVSMAWASNWQYTNDLPVEGDWRTVQSLPRRLTLRHTQVNSEVRRLVVASTPISLATLAPRHLHSCSVTSPCVGEGARSCEDIDFEGREGEGALEFTVAASSTLEASRVARLIIDIESDAQSEPEGISIGYADSQVWVDRSGAQRSWSNPFFTDKLSTFVQPRPGDRHTISLRGIVDRSVLELFVNDGEQSAVVLFFLGAGRRPGRLRVQVSGGMHADVSLTALRGIYRHAS